jgi:sugar/nucleoside kinase (ribokinase family)
MLRLAYAEGRRLEDPGNLTFEVAGSEVNVAYALARLGVPVTWLGAALAGAPEALLR